MTREQLEQIAALVRPLLTMKYQRGHVFLGISTAALDALLLFGARAERTVYLDDAGGRPYVIASAYLMIDGVEFRAQAESQPATDAEAGAGVPR